MANRRTQIQDLVGRRRNWTPIAILHDPEGPVTSRLLELAERRRWRWVSLNITGGKLPSDAVVRGALVNELPTSPIVRELLARKIPTVRLGGRPHPDDAKVPAAVHDSLKAGRVAAEHFAERGFEHVAYVGRDPWAGFKPMYDAYADRARELGCDCHLLQENIDKLEAQLEPGGDLVELRRANFTRWLEQQPKPLGLFTFGDYAAALYCQWVVQAGLRVPEDVAVLGMFNHQFVCGSAAVPLSSIAIDESGVADAAVRMLAQLIDGEPIEQTTVLVPPVGVVARQSTDVLAASDPLVVAAIRFMWDHIAEDLSVDRIARHAGVSRRTLERAFEKDLGRGISREFQRRRLEKARELICQTDWRMAEIVDALHFGSQAYFCRVFRDTYGVSPTQCRAQHRAAT